MKHVNLEAVERLSDKQKIIDKDIKKETHEFKKNL